MYKASLDGSGFASGAAQINSHLHQMGINTSAASANLGGLGTLLGTMANPLTAVALGITAVGGALVGSAQAAAAWESSMTGVAKTTGLAGPELEKLSQDLLQMSTTVPLAASELASIAAAGGSLGIAKDQLAGFTEVAAQMGVGFEMGADQAATAGAKILNAFGKEMSVDNFRSLGSVVNTMGDAFAATEPQVLDFLNRASFLNSTMGQSIPQVAALGTTLISTGLEAEVAATGIKSMLNMLTSETSKTGGMNNWAKLMGTSVEELKTMVATDLNSTLIETANKIAAIEDPVERFQAAVQSAGSEGAPALLKLAGQQDNYAKALGMTNSEWEKANSLQKTFDAQAGTVNSQWTMFTNTLQLAATQLGTGMLPALGQALGFMTDLAKVAIKVGETLADLGAGDVLDTIWKLTPAGMLANSETAQSVWGDIKEWAGIGTEHAEQMAKEIEESDKLQKAGAEGLQAGIDAGVLKDPAKKAAQEFSKEFVAEFELAQADREIANILADSANGMTAQDTDEALRTFDYLGEQFALNIRAHTGAAIGDWYTYSLKAGDTSLVNDQIGTGYIDPLAAFEMATGLPAPAKGTEAYYRLLGDNIAAEKAKLQAQLKDPFDYSGIGSDLLPRMENEGAVIGKIGSDRAKDAYIAFLDNFREPAVEKLSDVLHEIEVLATERPLAASEYQLFGENYKDRLYASITDMKPYLKGLFGDLGETGTNAFSDRFFSDAEKQDLLGMKPWLEYLQQKSPEEFAKAGGDSWLKFIDAIEAGASSAELEKMFGDMGVKSGKAFTDAITGATLGMGETRTLVDILGGDRSEITDLIEWRKNTFQPALQMDFDLIYKQAQSYYADDVELMRNWFDEKIEYAEKYSDDFEQWQLNILAMVKSNDLTEMQAAQLWSGAIKKSEERMEKLAKDSGMFYGELINNQAKWEDFINSEGGFVGPTAYYDDYREATDPNKLVSQKINEKYGIATSGSNSIDYTLNIDTTTTDFGLLAVDKKLADIKTSLETPYKFDLEFNKEEMEILKDMEDFVTKTGKYDNKKILLDTGNPDEPASDIGERWTTTPAAKPFVITVDDAILALERVDKAAMRPVTKPLKIDDLAAIESINRINTLAAVPVYKTIYINEVSSGSYSASSSVQSSGYDWSQNQFPTLYAGGGYVDRPTLGIFGEAGGEFLVPEHDMASLIESLTSRANVNVGTTIDDSGISEQLSSAISKITVPPIMVPIQVEVDSAQIQEAVSKAIAVELSGVRARRR